MTTENKIALVIHGGAGTILRENMTPETEAAYITVLTEALNAGYKILEEGGTALDAVEASVKIMEDSPLFNAGVGSVYTAAGTQEMDASIMDGSNLMAGAVAGVTFIKNPITAARLVMEKSPHVMLIGEGAHQFSKNNNIEMVDPSYFYNERRWQQLQKIRDSEKIKLDHDGGSISPEDNDKKYGTVGAVALDKNGNLAAATSTGGMTNKKFGRIGDSPIIGAGTYANNKTCAVSATGHGEYFIRGVICYDISAMMEYGNISLQQAAHEVINNKLTAAGGTGGIIAVDAIGNISMEFNTAGMYRAYRTSAGEKEVLIYRK